MVKSPCLVAACRVLTGKFYTIFIAVIEALCSGHFGADGDAIIALLL